MCIPILLMKIEDEMQNYSRKRSMRKKNLDPKMREETTTQTVDVPDDVDAELLAKVLANPEMKALLASLAKAMT